MNRILQIKAFSILKNSYQLIEYPCISRIKNWCYFITSNHV